MHIHPVDLGVANRHRLFMFSPLKDRWQDWSKMSINREIFSAALSIAVVTVLVKGVFIYKEVVQAWLFGTGKEMDSFLMALVLPNFVIFVIAGSFNAAFIPTYIQVKEQQGEEAAQRLLSSTIFLTMAALAVLMMALLLIARPLVETLSDFTPIQTKFTMRLFYCITPAVFLNGMVIICSAVLNAEKQFVAAALTPLLTPLLTLLLLVLTPSWRIYCLAAGLNLGGLVELFVLGAALSKQGIYLRPRWGNYNAPLRQVGRQSLPMLMGSLMMNSSAIIDQSMATTLGPGNLAALNYAAKFIAFPLGLGTTALATAAIPHLSSMVAARKWIAIQHTCRRYLRLIFVTMVPLTIVFVASSKWLVRVCFERGSFNPNDTVLVSGIQSLAALQIPFYVAGIFMVRLVSAMKLNQILMWVGIMNLFLKVILNYIFMEWLGVAGVALSTSCVYFCSFLVVFIYTKKALRREEDGV